MTRQERRKRRRQRRRRMQAGILLSLVLVLGLIIALRAGKERETLEQEIPLAAERQTLAYIAPAPALPETAAEETPEEPEEPPVEPEPENRYAAGNPTSRNGGTSSTAGNATTFERYTTRARAETAITVSRV